MIQQHANDTTEILSLDVVGCLSGKSFSGREIEEVLYGGVPAHMAIQNHKHLHGDYLTFVPQFILG